jgi:hypothetical protein
MPKLRFLSQPKALQIKQEMQEIKDQPHTFFEK